MVRELERKRAAVVMDHGGEAGRGETETGGG